mmetsp:Transcript_27767/g.5085  ORF Transcript_27767/g.5085 Transcript_27767/m.5085 type:complete len:101 (+) Transcript_27767:1747-2049(+)
MMGISIHKASEFAEEKSIFSIAAIFYSLIIIIYACSLRSGIVLLAGCIGLIYTVRTGLGIKIIFALLLLFLLFGYSLDFDQIFTDIEDVFNSTFGLSILV